jgi:hypothetical protein
MKDVLAGTFLIAFFAGVLFPEQVAGYILLGFRAVRAMVG